MLVLGLELDKDLKGGCGWTWMRSSFRKTFGVHVWVRVGLGLGLGWRLGLGLGLGLEGSLSVGVGDVIRDGILTNDLDTPSGVASGLGSGFGLGLASVLVRCGFRVSTATMEGKAVSMVIQKSLSPKLWFVSLLSWIEVSA